MSWSLTATAQYADVEDAINNAAASPDSTASEQVEQVSAVKAAAIGIVKSLTVVNDAGQDVYVTASGHANPDHKPAPNWANDVVTVSVGQVTRQTADA